MKLGSILLLRLYNGTVVVWLACLPLRLALARTPGQLPAPSIATADDGHSVGKSFGRAPISSGLDLFVLFFVVVLLVQGHRVHHNQCKDDTGGTVRHQIFYS